jgi:DNA-binding response OmpR family regulator
MSNEKFTAFILDKDPDQSKKIISVVDKLFTKVFLQPSPESAPKDFLDNKPNALFLNLNIDQRETSFRVLEQILKLNAHPCLIFAYLDEHEPELIAHAIENGILDVFMRPFDGDLIASKVSRFLKGNAASVEQNLLYTKLYKPLKAQVEFSYKLVSVDENGLTMMSENYINKGTKFQINSPLMNEIFEDPTIAFMVTKTWFDEQKNLHFLFAEPWNPKESQNSSLRRFILGKL